MKLILRNICVKFKVRRTFIFGAVILCAPCFGVLTMAQITIRDTIVINPGTATKLQPKHPRSVQSGNDPLVVTLKYTYASCADWSTPDPQPPVCRFDQPCGSSETKAGAYCGESRRCNASDGCGDCSSCWVNTISWTFTPHEPGNYTLTVLQGAPHGYGACCGTGWYWDTFVSAVDNRGFSYSDHGGTVGYNYTGNCSPEDLQPQTFDGTSVEKYGEGDSFDPQDGGLPYRVTMCPLPSLDPNRDVEGATGMILSMPNYPPTARSWTPINHSDLTACIDNDRWRFKVHNLRVPIFSSCCIWNYVNLGDGCDPNVLSQEITTRELYEMALDDLNWWFVGPSRHERGSHPSRFAFCSGIMAHEYYHFQKDSAEAASEINNAYQAIFSMNVPYTSGVCLSDVLNNNRPFVNDALTRALNNASVRWAKMKEWEEQREQKEADTYAQDEYKRIEQCLKAWGAARGW